MSSDQKNRVSRMSYAGRSGHSGLPVESKRNARHSLASTTALSNNGTASAAFSKATKPSSRQSVSNAEESNISVYVRCRSRNDREIKENSGVVVSTMGHMGKEVLLQTGPMSVSNKTYTFDRVFGAESDQEMIYEGIAKSVLQEMLQGYNCTIFAYGQTGTGKTYTMSGDIQSNGRLSEEAGIIPRTLMDLFKSLESHPEYSVKVSFIELYNEELSDLLLVNHQEERKVRIFEDPSKKSIVVQGMEEVYIKSVAEGMKLLNDGSYKRQVASTQCNDLSSRSHSVFTITVHMKEIDPISGEEYLKIGKLNLVDLAGSENINRSGAENKRAREAGMINQSLLTLGRVINALVDNSAHVPYRESKLTRLLQDSLGGRTKTCIIATISPAKVSLDETISTLEYANRAKSIKNKPQVNQTMSKKLLIKEYVEEIERLRNDLNATRNKNGIYLTEENWNKITAESESRRIHVEEQRLRIQVLEEQIKKFKIGFDEYLTQIKNSENELKMKENQNLQLRNELNEKSKVVEKLLKDLRIEVFVNEDHQDVEAKLTKAYGSLIQLAQELNTTKEQLFKHIDHQKTLGLKNAESLEKSKAALSFKADGFLKDLKVFSSQSLELSKMLDENFTKMVHTQRNSISKKCETFQTNSKTIGETINNSLDKFLSMIASAGERIDGMKIVEQKIRDEILLQLNFLQNENLHFSNEIENNLKDLDSTVSKSFNDINSHIRKTFATVTAQMNAQSKEIILLQANLSDHQKKYNKLLHEQTTNLIRIKELEEKESQESQIKLLAKISKLIEEHEISKTQRLNKSIDVIHPELTKIESKHESFTDNFESFIHKSWVANQNKFVEQLKHQSTNLEEEIIEKQASKVNSKTIEISKVSQKHKETDDENFHKVIKNLDRNISGLDKFSNELKKLNNENRTFTEAQLNSIKHVSQETIESASQQFQTVLHDLEKTKPHVIDSFLNKRAISISDFDKVSTSKIAEIQSNINEINFNFENNQPLPKRQKLKELQNFEKPLPQPKTRDEIVKLITDKSDPTPIFLKSEDPGFLANEISAPIPIPDRKIKTPLTETLINPNIPSVKMNSKGSADSDYDIETDVALCGTTPRF